MNKQIENYEIFYIGIISKIVKNGYMVQFSGKTIFINSDKKFNLNDSVVVAFDGRKYFILDKSSVKINKEKKVKII